MVGNSENMNVLITFLEDMKFDITDYRFEQDPLFSISYLIIHLKIQILLINTISIYIKD